MSHLNATQQDVALADDVIDAKLTCYGLIRELMILRRCTIRSPSNFLNDLL